MFKQRKIAYTYRITSYNVCYTKLLRIFIAATCGDKGIAFLKGEAKENIRKVSKPSESKDPNHPETYTVTVEGEKYVVSIKQQRTNILTNLAKSS